MIPEIGENKTKKRNLLFENRDFIDLPDSLQLKRKKRRGEKERRFFLQTESGAGGARDGGVALGPRNNRLRSGPHFDTSSKRRKRNL